MPKSDNQRPPQPRQRVHGAAGDVSTAKTLKILAQEVAACTRCCELATTRTPEPSSASAIRTRGSVFLGEALGADEDKQGEPFVGRAGQLLNKILEACKLRREDVYILNILKCRPPGIATRSPKNRRTAAAFSTGSWN